MKAVVILTDTRRRGTCRSCGAAIEWATVAASGKAMPFNLPIVVVPGLTDGDPGGVRTPVVEVDMAQSSSHFSTCPQAAEWRRTRAKP